MKAQGQCASDWAFSAVGAMTGIYRTSALLDFSAQQLLDCTLSYGNHGCQGGSIKAAFYYAYDHPMTTSGYYDYTGKDSQCRSLIDKDRYNFGVCYDVKNNSLHSLKKAIAKTPISVMVSADN